MTWKVYLVQGRTGALYCGITTDLERRVKQHNSGKGSKWCRSFRPVKLVFHLSVDSKSEALRIEAAIKRFSRDEKLNLINKSEGSDGKASSEDSDQCPGSSNHGDDSR